MPKRIQRKRTKGFDLRAESSNPNGYRCVTRGTDWGNHWRIGDPDPDKGHPMTGPEVLARFEEDALKMALVNPAWLEPLRGKDLACFCPLDSPCHADILLRLANAPAPHPEDFCQKCGRPNIVWFAPSDLWNKYSGDRYGILCPVCFVAQAEEAGFGGAWKLEPEGFRPSPA